MSTDTRPVAGGRRCIRAEKFRNCPNNHNWVWSKTELKWIALKTKAHRP